MEIIPKNPPGGDNTHALRNTALDLTALKTSFEALCKVGVEYQGMKCKTFARVSFEILEKRFDSAIKSSSSKRVKTTGVVLF